ncbi:hypothetical protein [Pelagicoccus sp. SDUM812002]|uniref:hypothetical protein n=1 Tax=Pelagicoccus sp. SDUM812002 TaxID=3041266 RepID=UPI00280DBE29|nr:hypothetical protein [Pelagicoccus sp. SDUM812002]MDQ8187259.1 hypothetical protein [Pelagicoccus sp. SDUM812002]
MSQTEENNTPSKQPEATNDPVAEFADELHIVDAMKPAAAPTSDNKPLRYGTRKKKAGEAGPNIKDLSSVSSFEEEEEIEMDDLPIRATAPEELIDTRTTPSEPREEYGERRPRRNDRSRGERRERKPRERAPRKEADQQSAESETNTETAAAAKEEKGDRPERFGTVKTAPAAPREVTVDEFRPSRDGRSNPKRERKPRSAADSTRSTAPAKKKGLLSKIIAFFTGGEKEEEKKPQGRTDRDGNRERSGRGRRGPKDRQNRDGNREGGEGGGQRRRRRPRNRKPRQDGESGERRQRQNREGGENRRPRRPRRPRRDEGKPGDSDAREIGRRAREESEASK